MIRSKFPPSGGILCRNSRGVRYELFLKKPPKCYQAEGLCYDPSEDNPKILVNPKQTENELMNTIIHELAHAFFWRASEKRVTKFANTVTRFLRKEGWAKAEEAKPSTEKKKRAPRKKKK